MDNLWPQNDQNNVNAYIESNGDQNICSQKYFKGTLTLIRDSYYELVDKINSGALKKAIIEPEVNKEEPSTSDMPKANEENIDSSTEDSTTTQPVAICEESGRVSSLTKFFNGLEKSFDLDIVNSLKNDVDELDFALKLSCKFDAELKICSTKHNLNQIKDFVYRYDTAVEVTENAKNDLVSNLTSFSEAFTVLCLVGKGTETPAHEEL